MIRVLVADDHAVVRSGLAQLLAAAPDIEPVGAVSDGSQVLAAVDELAPDVVLMDLLMPGMDGVTATALVRRAHPEVHVLALTSLSEQRWIMDALEAGAEGYLLKNCEPETIFAAIRDVMAGGSPLDPKAARVLLDSRRRRESPLTAREREVLTMVAEGLGNRMIARRLGISERTVKAHLTQIYQRLGVADRTQAALWIARTAKE